jgi:uncharacterized protein (TIGR03435 family)
MKTTLAVISLVALCVGVLAQGPAFDVVSIRHAPEFRCCLNNLDERPGGGFTLDKGGIAVLIGHAYRISPSSVIGLPEWATNEAYDIIANGNVPNATTDDRQKMKQALLADRFKLQAHVETREQPAYDRRSSPGGPPISGTVIQGNRLRATNVSLLAPIRSVYFQEGLISERQFVGGPDWIRTERWNIDAVAAITPTRAQFTQMLRHLLTERFKVRAGREQLRTAATVLVRSPGASLQPTTCDTLISSRPEETRIAGRAIEMSDLAQGLTSYFDAPVLDRTGLSGQYDYDLTFVRDPLLASASNGVSLDTALQEQLGLRVERQRAVMDTLVIESAERPTLD